MTRAILLGALLLVVAATAKAQGFGDGLRDIEKRVTKRGKSQTQLGTAQAGTNQDGRQTAAPRAPQAPPAGSRVDSDTPAAGDLRRRPHRYDRAQDGRVPSEAEQAAREKECPTPERGELSNDEAVAIEKDPQGSYDYMAAKMAVCTNPEKKARYLAWACDRSSTDYQLCRKYKSLAQECELEFDRAAAERYIDFADRVKKRRRCLEQRTARAQGNTRTEGTR